jgi:glycerol-3-phosphate acyltransferase PlsY
VPDLSPFMVALAGYLLGSFPTAYLAVRWKAGVDIRRAGSGNVGALNSYEVTRSRLVALLVLAIDLLKGILAVRLAGLIAPASGFDGAALGGVAAVAGHNFPVWLRFRGGRGLATAGGVLLILCWPLVPCWGLGWAVGFLITRRVNPANVVASLLMFALVLATPESVLRGLLPAGTSKGSLTIWSCLLVGLVLARHYQPVKEYVIERRRSRVVDIDKEERE